MTKSRSYWSVGFLLPKLKIYVKGNFIYVTALPKADFSRFLPMRYNVGIILTFASK